MFRDAGAEWREAGCSMCIAMNGDQLRPGQYAVSTSNRNFEGRQGAGGRTFLASPLTAAAAAVTGRDHRRTRSSHERSKTMMTRSADLSRDRRRCPMENIDTDQIIPARFLKATSKAGLGNKLFADWRYDADGRAQARLRAQPRRRRAGAQVLVAGAQLRLRVVARARALGAAGLRLPRGGQHRRSPTSSATTR